MDKIRFALNQVVLLFLMVLGLVECHATRTDCLPKDPTCHPLFAVVLYDPAYYANYSKLYWSDIAANKIQRTSTLNAEGVVDLVTGEPSPEGIAQSSARNLYWVGNSTTLRFSNSAGQGIVSLIAAGLSDADGIVLDEPNNRMYITDSGSSSVHSANLDGTGMTTVINSGIGSTNGNPALDPRTGLLYFANAATVVRDNPANSPTEQTTIVSGLTAARNIVLNTSNNTLYWADETTGKIQQASIDGTNVQDILTGLTSPYGLAVDLQFGKIYWSDRTNGKIWRANTDGSGVTLLVSGLSSPRFLTLGN